MKERIDDSNQNHVEHVAICCYIVMLGEATFFNLAIVISVSHGES